MWLQACFLYTRRDIYALDISEKLSLCIFGTEFFENWTEFFKNQSEFFKNQSEFSKYSAETTEKNAGQLEGAKAMASN